MENDNKYAAQLQQARNEDAERQRGNKQQQEMQDASENPDWKPDARDKKYKISGIMGALMIAVALIVDGLSALLGIFIITEPINWIVWIYAVLGFYVWLKMVGISWNDAKGKRTLMMFGGASGVEFIPYVNVLPAWTAFVIGIIINDRIEGVAASSPLAQKAMGMAQKKREEQEKEQKRKEEKQNEKQK